MTETKTQAMPAAEAAKTSGRSEETAREAYHGGNAAPAGGRDLGRKDPQESGDSEDGRENVPQR